MLSLPIAGPNRHPEHKTLAFDGRGRMAIASAGTVQEAELRGVLFWAFQRVAAKRDANLVQENVGVSMNMSFDLPGGGKRRKVSANE